MKSILSRVVAVLGLLTLASLSSTSRMVRQNPAFPPINQPYRILNSAPLGESGDWVPVAGDGGGEMEPMLPNAGNDDVVGDDKQCVCPAGQSNEGAENSQDNTISWTKVELRLKELEVWFLNVTNQKNDDMISLLNDTYSLRLTTSEMQEKIRNYDKTSKLFNSTLEDMKILCNDISTRHATFENHAVAVNTTLSKLNSLVNSVWSDMNDMDGVVKQLIKRDNSDTVSTNTSGYIFQQIEELRTQLAVLTRSPSMIDQTQKNWDTKPRDCDDWVRRGSYMSGVYEIWPNVDSSDSLEVYCRMSQGRGWLVMQRRKDGLTSFYRKWSDYEYGFGSLYGDFWLGNHYIFQLTSQRAYKLRVTVKDWENRVQTVLYNTFYLEGREEYYRLNIRGMVSDNAELSDPMKDHNNRRFSTYDNDATGLRCAETYTSGWWFANCLQANLNGRHSKSDAVFSSKNVGIIWDDGKMSVDGTTSPSRKEALMEISWAD